MLIGGMFQAETRPLMAPFTGTRVAEQAGSETILTFTITISNSSVVETNKCAK